MRKQGAVASQGGSGFLIGGIAVALAIAAGAYMYLNADIDPSDAELTALVPDNANDDARVDEPSSAPDDATAAQPQPQETDADDPVETALQEPQPPTIDEVRLERDGVAVVAGRAEPGSDVEVVVDGEVIATIQADGSGSFAALGLVTPSDQPRVLSLRAKGSDEVVVASLEEVILAPQLTPLEPAKQTEQPAVETAEIEQDGFEAASNEAPDETIERADTTVEATEPPAEAPAKEQVASRDASDRLDEPSVEDATEAPTETSERGVAEAEEVQETPSVAAPESTAEVASVENVEATQDTAVEADPQPVETAPTVAEAEPEAETVEAERQIALLKSDEEGVTLLQSAPTQPERIVLDTIGYSDSGVVQLAGRANEDAVEVRVYINNQAFASLPVESSGSWRGDVPDIDTGVYTLRVDAVDAEGGVTSRIETPFKREEPEILAAASNASTGPVRSITVQTGDTLWAIARDRYGEGVLFVQVFEANKASIRDPDLIYPGQVFDLPDE